MKIVFLLLFFLLCKMQKIAGHNTYLGLEFVVANTLAKWKKLKPNEIDLS